MHKYSVCSLNVITKNLESKISTTAVTIDLEFWFYFPELQWKEDLLTKTKFLFGNHYRSGQLLPMPVAGCHSQCATLVAHCNILLASVTAVSDCICMCLFMYPHDN